MKKIIFHSLLLIIFLVSFTNCKNKASQEVESTTEETITKDGKWKGCVVGIYPATGNEKLPTGNLQEIDDFEVLTQQKVGSVVWFPTWEDEFPTLGCNKLAARGIIPHLTWELFWPSVDHNAAQTGPDGYVGFQEVLNGTYDDYIDRFAEDAKAFEKEVLIRFLHEFNGNWYVWSGNKNGEANGGPAQVVKVWKYVVDRFKAKGANNVKWLWTPHGPSTDRSTEAWNHVSNYWPGADYVDWIGLDGYNFYPKDPWGGTRPFRDFDNCFRQLYDDCAVLGDQPMMIAEFGSGEFEVENKNKATWITDAFNKIKTTYPRVKIFTWFDIKKELDWRVNSSPEALEAFQEAMEDPYFVEGS